MSDYLKTIRRQAVELTRAIDAMTVDADESSTASVAERVAAFLELNALEPQAGPDVVKPSTKELRERARSLKVLNDLDDYHTSELSTAAIKKRIESLRKLTAINKETMKDLDDDGLAAVAEALKAEHRRREKIGQAKRDAEWKAEQAERKAKRDANLKVIEAAEEPADEEVEAA
jgi:hypothetical protein